MIQFLLLLYLRLNTELLSKYWLASNKTENYKYIGCCTTP